MRGTRKRKLEQEENQPNKYQKTEEDDDILSNEKFECFLSLPVELQNEIYQRCTFPVKIHFNEVCKAFSVTGGWLHDLPNFQVGDDVKPHYLTRFTSFNRLYCNEVSLDGLEAPYLTSLEELRLDSRGMKFFFLHYIKMERLIPVLPYLTNLRKLKMPRVLCPDEDMFGHLTKLTSLQTLHIKCNHRLVEKMAVFKYLTKLCCSVNRDQGETGKPAFDVLTNLKKLQISSFYGGFMDTGLTHLEGLKLFDADLDDINSIQHFTNLTQLEFGTWNDKTVEFSFQMPQVKNLSLRRLTGVSEALLRKFPNLTTYSIRGYFILPPNAEQLTNLSLRGIEYKQENLDLLAKLTNLQSLKIKGYLGNLVCDDDSWNLTTTLRELEVEESDSLSLYVPILTKLVNLERATFCVKYGSDQDEEEHIKQFLKAMTQLKHVSFKGVHHTDLQMPFHHHKSWFDYLRKNKIYTDVKFK